ncbi:hypothetical protein DL96DRAFT_1705160 [Flagelloscypha sp. PMI_526]|nr:hypothetical protein DL96DRAFT_1705160 [Flagelloscypha sp. PMI_526]
MVRARRDLLGHSLDLNSLLGLENTPKVLTRNILSCVIVESLGTIPGDILGELPGEPLSGLAEHSSAKDPSNPFDDLGKIMATHKFLLLFPRSSEVLRPPIPCDSHRSFRLPLKWEFLQLITPLLRLANASWTTCPCVGRDGKVNPDVRILPGVGPIQYVLDTIRQNTTAPNVDFGKVIRDPGAKGLQRTWTCILDLRGLVKVLNSITVLKAAGSLIWTSPVDRKEVASRGNNNVTFYVSQVAAAGFYSGVGQGAAAVLQGFGNAFQVQIAKTGEQPFGAARTHPQHYQRLILKFPLGTNAKLGDQIGKNSWHTESKYGATFEGAVDFAVRKPFGSEDSTKLTPHVAAVAAQYGDPSSTHSAFLCKHQPNYSSQPYWFYD